MRDEPRREILRCVRHVRADRSDDRGLVAKMRGRKAIERRRVRRRKAVKRRNGDAEPLEIGNLVVAGGFGHSPAADRLQPERPVRRRILEGARQTQPRIARIETGVQGGVRAIVAHRLVRSRDFRVRDCRSTGGLADERRRFLGCVFDDPLANLFPRLDPWHQRCRVEHQRERADLAVVRHDPEHAPEPAGESDALERSDVARVVQRAAIRVNAFRPGDHPRGDGVQGAVDLDPKQRAQASPDLVVHADQRARIDPHGRCRAEPRQNRSHQCGVEQDVAVRQRLIGRERG